MNAEEFMNGERNEALIIQRHIHDGRHDVNHSKAVSVKLLMPRNPRIIFFCPRHRKPKKTWNFEWKKYFLNFLAARLSFLVAPSVLQHTVCPTLL